MKEYKEHMKPYLLLFSLLLFFSCKKEEPIEVIDNTWELFSEIAYQSKNASNCFSYKDKKGNTGSGSLYPTQQWTSWVNSTQTSFYDFIDKSKTVNHYRSSRCLHEGKVKTWGFFRRRDNQKLQTFDLGELTL